MSNHAPLLTKSDKIGFATNFTAVVLGIAITFLVDGIIEKNGQRQRADEILVLVQEELEQDVEGLESMSDVIRQENQACNYILKHKDNYSDIPDDSLYLFGNILFEIPEIQMDNLTDDLIKTDDFQNGIDDNKLKLKITEAFLNLEIIKLTFNNRSEYLNNLLKDAQDEKYKEMVVKSDSLGREIFNKILFSTEGIFFIKQVQGTSTSTCQIIESRLKLVKETVDEIEKYLD